MKKVGKAILIFFLVANTICIVMQMITHTTVNADNIIACLLLSITLIISE